MSREYALSLAGIGIPDASPPRLRTWIDIVPAAVTPGVRAQADDPTDRDCLTVPTIDTWTPDMLGLVLHFLDTRIDAPHAKADAHAVIQIAGKRPPRVDLIVEARGWRAGLPLWIHHPRFRMTDFPSPDEFHAAVRQDTERARASFDPAMLDYLRSLAAAPVSLAEIPDPANGRRVAVTLRPADHTIRRRLIAATFRETVIGPLRDMLRQLPPEDRALVIDRLHDAIDHAENS